MGDLVVSLVTLPEDVEVRLHYARPDASMSQSWLRAAVRSGLPEQYQNG